MAFEEFDAEEKHFNAAAWVLFGCNCFLLQNALTFKLA